ncbi:Pol polyprotein/retrotransposon [Ceratobasidium sp. AG-Ba]|nr:Pol polyprotein/retrotransposon [Ceratobasidium sp. AG-Ba]
MRIVSSRDTSTENGRTPESCPQKERIGEKPCPLERTSETAARPSSYPLVPAFEQMATPSFYAEAEATTKGGTTPFQTPSKTAKVPEKAPGVSLKGARFFAPNVLVEEEYNTIEMLDQSETEPEAEQRSDETLRQDSKQKKRRSKKKQRDADAEYLRDIVRDETRFQEAWSIIEHTVPGGRSLLEEIRSAALENGYEAVYGENDEYLTESDLEHPYTEYQPCTESLQMPESSKAGPSYFDKGKWVNGSDYEANQEFIAAQKAQRAPEMIPEPSPKTTKKKPCKARPSLGIRIDEIQPARTKVAQSKLRTNLRDSLAALPGGGYFATKMRAKSEDPNMSNKVGARKNNNPPDDSGSSSSSDSESSDGSSDTSDSTSSSDGSSKQRKHKNKSNNSPSRKLRKEKYRDEYQKKYKKLQKQIRRAKRSSAKVKEPTPYRGQANYDALELFDYQFDH